MTDENLRNFCWQSKIQQTLCFWAQNSIELKSNLLTTEQLSIKILQFPHRFFFFFFVNRRRFERFTFFSSKFFLLQIPQTLSVFFRRQQHWNLQTPLKISFISEPKNLHNFIVWRRSLQVFLHGRFNFLIRKTTWAF